MSWASQGGIFKKFARATGKKRGLCIGQGMRSVVALEPAPKRTRVEGEEEGEEEGERKQELVAVRKRRPSALKDVYEQVHRAFEKWRMAGQYVDHQNLLCEFR